MRKKIKILFSFIVIVLISFVFTIGNVYGWLIKSEKSEFGMGATVRKFYYESGDGLSPETAFEIAKPMQFYYFSWLQNLGFYNATEGDETAAEQGKMVSPVYFRISQDLDMTGFVLPSVGTSDNPFVGVLDGGGYSVNNLTVSNTKDESEITYPPNGAGSISGFQIVGVFGVIGKLSNASVTYDTSAATVKNLSLNNVTVKTEEPENGTSLIGVFAGYVSGSVENVTVSGGNAVLEDEIMPLSTYSSEYSEYFLVGYCEDESKSLINLNFTEISVPYTDSGYLPGSVTLGPGDNWGGSIDMKALNLRLYDLLNSGEVTYSSRKYLGYYEKGDQAISVGRGEDIQNYLSGNPETRRIFYNLFGDGTHTYRNENFNMPGTYIPLLVDDNYDTLDCNTGYIVSDTQSLSGISGTIRSSSYEMRFISNSLDDVNKTREQVYSGAGGNFPVYDKTKTEIITNYGAAYSANNFVLIKDETEGFNSNHVPLPASAVYGIGKGDYTTPSALNLNKYNAARLSLDTVLYGSDFIHGIHFVGSSINMNKIITVENAIINRVNYENYQLPKSSINFKVKEEGHINCFAGSYYARTNNSWADSFFSLHEVTRNGNVISGIKEIKFVYYNTDYNPNDVSSKRYVYQFAGESKPLKAGDLAFDMRFLTEQPPVDNALYYFEIPVNAGEYALGTVENKNGGGYLMYLDISASAVSAEGEKIAERKRTTVYKYDYPTGVNLFGEGTIPNAVIAEPITSTGEKAISLSTSPTDGFTALLIRNAESHLITKNAVVVKLKGIEEILEERVTIEETINGEMFYYVITTVTILYKDASGNLINAVTTCSATLNGNSIPPPSGYGEELSGISGSIALRYRFTDFGGEIVSDYGFSFVGEDELLAVTIISDSSTTVFIEEKSQDYVVTVNGTEVAVSDEIAIIPA